jgi:hypothetical protein
MAKTHSAQSSADRVLPGALSNSLKGLLLLNCGQDAQGILTCLDLLEYRPSNTATRRRTSQYGAIFG